MSYDDWEAQVDTLLTQYKQDVKDALANGADPNTVGVPILPPPPHPK